MKVAMKMLAVLTAGLLMTQAHAASPTSLRLTDTVDKGIGAINLFKDLTATQLESYRVDHSGLIVLGVDVNEAANGSEKASSQGVAVESASLVVSFANGTSKTYSSFFSETQSILAKAGSVTKSPYYTLLGESGSSRITSGNQIQSVFDSTLKIRVPDSLTGVTAATIQIRFVDPNVKLGDPEAFYDFTAGFEDLALLNKVDATYLDTTLVTESTFRTESPVMTLSPEGTITATTTTTTAPAANTTKVYYPGNSTYWFSAFEDSFPLNGDYDFNDVVVAYRLEATLNDNAKMTELAGQAYLVARGARRTHDWALNLSIPTMVATGNAVQCETIKPDGSAVPCSIGESAGSFKWTPYQDTLAIFPQTNSVDGGMSNTATKQDFQKGPKASFKITFATPIDLPANMASQNNYQPELKLRDTQIVINLSTVDSKGWPFGLVFPSGWSWPLERIDIGGAYPELSNFVNSGRTLSQDWYTRPTGSMVHSPRQSRWEW